MNSSTAWKWGAAALAVAFLVPLTLIMIGGVAVVASPPLPVHRRPTVSLS
ncbi:hypothetical protein OG989_18955 [Micromonospora sp. NBC_01740]|nr:hypothetical protein OG989_18955 [Micromonospora sp. NBC_01740]